MKILFVNLSALKFTVATPDSAPLGGSESSVCYLARALARRGHSVSLTANLPDDAAQIVQNIPHFSLTVLKDPAFLASEIFDVIVICNAPAAALPLKNASPNSRIIFWAHALPDQPAMQILAQNDVKAAIDGTVFVSKWQRGEVERVFGTFTNAQVIGNGIAPAFENMFSSSTELLAAKQNRAAYTTTPYRGLSVLLRAMQDFERDTRLDIFSSMKTYQAADDEYAHLFEQATQNPVITVHGSLPQQILAQNLRRNAFLFYPSIYRETFCISALEAMAAGMKVISTHCGALPETMMGFADLVPIMSNDGDILVQDFRAAMRRAADDFVDHPEKWAQDRFAQMQTVNEIGNWDARAQEWDKLFL